MRTICAKQRIAANSLGTHDKRAGAVHRAAGDMIVGLLFHGNRLAGNHRFIDAACAFQHHAVNGIFLAGPHSQSIAELHLIQRHIVFTAVSFDASAPFSAQAPATRGWHWKFARAPAVPALGPAARA